MSMSRVTGSIFYADNGYAKHASTNIFFKLNEIGSKCDISNLSNEPFNMTVYNIFEGRSISEQSNK